MTASNITIYGRKNEFNYAHIYKSGQKCTVFLHIR